MRAPWWTTTRGDVVLAVSDAALIILTALTGVGMIAWAPGSWWQASPWLALLAAAPGVIGVALRHLRLWPSVAMIALGLLLSVACGHSVAVFLLTFELLFTLVLLGGARGRGAARTLAAALTLALVVAAFASGQGLDGALAVALMCAVTLWLPIAWGGDLRTSDALRRLEAVRADEAASSSAQRAELAVARERARMAGELHDTVSGHLSAIALQSQAAALTADASKQALILQEIRAGSLAALEEMRGLIGVLQSGGALPQPGGSLADLPALAARATAAGHVVETSMEHGLSEGPTAVGADIGSAAFRVASEGVTNALKHAPGSALRVVVGTAPEGVSDIADSRMLEVRVTNGPPRLVGTRNSGNGLGLVQLAARVEALGGTLRGGPLSGGERGGGWELLARLPLSDRATPASLQPALSATTTSTNRGASA